MALDPAFVDLYSLLDVSSSASAGAIRKAYLLAARASHPDKNPGDAEAAARFDAVKQAADVLLDSAKRAEYDTRYDRYIDELARRAAMAAETRAMQEALEQREAQAAAASQEAAPWTAHAANRADVAAARADWEAYKESLQEQQHAAEAAARRAAGPHEDVTVPQAAPAPAPASGMDATAKVKWSRDIAARYGFSQPGQGLGGLSAQELLLTMLRAVFKAPAQVASATLVKKRAAIVQFSDRRQAVAAAANPPAGFSVSLTVPLGPHADVTEGQAPDTPAVSGSRAGHPAGTTPPAPSGQAAPQAAKSSSAVPPPPAAAGLTSEQVAMAARMVQAREAALFAWLDRQAPHES